MKQRLLGCVVILASLSPLGCLSDGELTDLVAGESAQQQSVNPAAAANLLTNILGDESTDEISERELLATLIEFFAASRSATGGDALMWDLAANAARDGRDGMRRAVAEFVLGQVAGSVTGMATP